MLGTPSSMIYGRVLAPPPCTCGRRLQYHVAGPKPTTFTPKPTTTSPAEPSVISTMPNVPVFQQPTAPPPIRVAVPLQIPAPAPPQPQPPPAAHGYCDDPEHAQTELCMNPVSATGHDAQATKPGGKYNGANVHGNAIFLPHVRLLVRDIVPGSRILVDGTDFTMSNGAWEDGGYAIDIPSQGEHDIAISQPDQRRLRTRVSSHAGHQTGRIVLIVQDGAIAWVPDYGFVPGGRNKPLPSATTPAKGLLYGATSMSGGGIPRPYSGPYDLRQWERGAAGVGRMNDMMIGSRPGGDQPMPWHGPVNVRGWSGPGRGIDVSTEIFHTLPAGERADITARMAGVPQSAEGDAAFANLVDAAEQRAGAFQRCVAMYSAMPLADQTSITTTMARAGLAAGSPEYAQMFCQLIWATPSARPVSTRSGGTVRKGRNNSPILDMEGPTTASVDADGNMDFTGGAGSGGAGSGAACNTPEYQDCVAGGGMACARLCGDPVQGGDKTTPQEDSALDYISSVGDIGLRGLGQFLDHDLRGRALDLQQERLRLDDSFRRAQLEAGRGNADAANEAADLQRQIRDNESRGRDLAVEAHSQGTSRQQQGVPTWAVAAAVALALAATGYAVMQARR
jgi:hypothetical protein